ncbi:MAG: bifunctional serine/threonine-protein kinase/formylglycine-generating enzyme family protein, partial [Planctomycetota bacterium]|nr:bifunctional serine/threonine-protein kinase/formylglycine-generating enzyme family protein [Planctomycetota bacterium]
QENVSQKAGARVVEDMAKALAYAHSFGIIHRDVKPQNVLIDKTSKAHLTDFGVAKANNANEGFTTTGALVGTLSYMSPEQAEDAKHIDRTADVYSLGAILYHILAGRPPHTGVTHTNILMSLATKTPPRPSTVNKETDPLLEAICLKALSKDPKDRYQSADDLASAIHNFRQGNHEDLSALLENQKGDTTPRKTLILALIPIFIGIAALIFAFSNSKVPEEVKEVEARRDLKKNYEVSAWSLSPRSLVNSPQITLSGRVDPGIEKVIAAKQSAAVVDGKFSVELALSEGLNKIPFEFFLGSEDTPVLETKFRVYADFTKPVIQLDELPRSSKLGDLAIQGSCEDLSEVQLRCGNFQETLSEARFKFTVKIRSGPNHFALHAMDKAGNKTMRPFTIIGDSAEVIKEPRLVLKPKPLPKREPKPEPKTNPEPKPKSKRKIKIKKSELFELLTQREKDAPLEEAVTLEFKIDPRIERIKWDDVNYDTKGKDRWTIYVRPSKRDRKFKAKIIINDKKVAEFKVVVRASEKLKNREALIGRYPLLENVELSARRYKFTLKASIPKEPGLASFPILAIPQLKKRIKVDKNGRFTLTLRHQQILRGLVAELTFKDRVEYRDLVRPLPLLHDIKLWKQFGSSLGLKRLSQEIDLASKILGPDFEKSSILDYKCRGTSFRIARFRHKATGIDFHLIPGGQFQMGSAFKDHEKPIHQVSIKPFLIGRRPVEGMEYYQTYAPNKAEDKRKKEGGRPIDEIDFGKALRFLKYTDNTLRLPSEAEWEYAARGGSQTKYYWGDDFDPEYCWYKGNSSGKRLALDKHKDKFNAFGLIDMLGHVAEWVMDTWSESYVGAPIDGSPVGKAKDKYGVIRGGAIGGDGRDTIDDCRSASRHKIKRRDKNGDYDDVGFRVVHDLKIPREVP